MIKLVIADDEPLVCVGLQSMLKWEEWNIEVVGTARNGQQAMDMIHQFKPDIVISDIKMPIKSGLEVAEECVDTFGTVPLFIFLTSFDEFELVRRAIRIQAVDYLVKLELTPESLSAAVAKAVERLYRYKRTEAPVTALRNGFLGLREKFFIRLYNNLFEDETQYQIQCAELELDFSAPFYTVCSCEIEEPKNGMNGEKLLGLYNSTIKMIRETLGKTHTCYITTLDMRHFSIAFCLHEQNPDIQHRLLEQALRKTMSMVDSYFKISFRAAVGPIIQNPFHLSKSYSIARSLLHEATEHTPIVFFIKLPDHDADNRFDFITIRSDIRSAFEELNINALHGCLSTIADYFARRPDLRIEAMDAACNVLYMAISLLPDGESIVTQIFHDELGGYRVIYSLNSTDAIVEWLLKLRDGCCGLLSSRTQSYKQQVILNVQEYIRENMDKKLSLNKVASVFNFSPSYLSQLFAKYAREGFVEYITNVRIEAAKEMIAKGDGKIYEIAERLGFESAYYFSKVFKKVEGMSPREYMHQVEMMSPST